MALGLKDIKLVLTAAEYLNVPLPITSMVRDHFLSGLAHHLHNATLPDSGFAGEILLGEHLTTETKAIDAQLDQFKDSQLWTEDLKYGVGLNHLPSGRFAANGAWLGLNVIAHNLARWVARIGLGTETTLTTRTLRRRLLCLPGRLTRSARTWTLHLPRDWPWANAFIAALQRLRAIPPPLRV